MDPGKVEFYRHSLGQAEHQAVGEVINSLFLTTGQVCARFEEGLARYLGKQRAVACATGTAALTLALKALDIGPGDEVVTTPMTFIATSNACLYVGAKPVFADVDPITANLDPKKAEAAITPRTKAIMPVHLYGTLCDMPAFAEIASRHGLKLVTDCAHALEATRGGYNSAAHCDLACYSFYATKNLSCGEGGALVTNDEAVADRLKVLRNHGMSKGAADRFTGPYAHWDMEELGLKANLPDILAAVLIPQIPRLAEMLKRRREIAARYEAAFAQMPGVDFPKVPADAQSARHVFTIWVSRRDEFLAGLQKRGIGVAVNYRAVHLLKYYRKTFGYNPGQFPEAERIGDSTLTLPLYPGLSDAEVDRVIEAVEQVAAELA